ncbi:hypothetical protein [Gluconacetobacter diazotrophicus]|uniref:Uncharacterized protein n=1 Tax=Gluconacetobacter diazotrophicus TaxID=33996 RepID=A0A7W4I706_GLUDI|nr:hypothetical protein [Gluconacetobacter diazotrophicus]MBB2157427.1 hypothetical protein [Gluconacetobacter diazotrophicus]
MTSEWPDATKARFYLPFEGKKWFIVDRETGAALKISSTPKIDILKSEFSYDNKVIRIGFQIKSKYPHLPFHTMCPENPYILLILGGLYSFFKNDPNYRKQNREIFSYIFHMIAYANRLRPLATNPYFWVDEQQRSAPMVDLPSDDEIFQISERPLQGIPDLKTVWYHGQ